MCPNNKQNNIMNLTEKFREEFIKIIEYSKQIGLNTFYADTDIILFVKETY